MSVMNKTYIAATLFVSCLILASAVSCRSLSSSPLTPTSTSITPGIGQVLNITIEPEPGATITNGIVLEGGTVSVGTMEFMGVNGWTDIRLNTGDPCLLITGSFNNTSNQNLQVSFFAEGYDAKGKQTAWTMDSGPLAGILASTISARSSRTFVIHLNWTPDTSVIKIQATSYTELAPLP